MYLNSGITTYYPAKNNDTKTGRDTDLSVKKSFKNNNIFKSPSQHLKLSNVSKYDIFLDRL